MEYSQNATLVFISAYAIYVFLGKIRTPHALHSGTLLLRNNDTAVDTFVSTAVSVLVEVTGLEPAASCSQSRHSSQTELHLGKLLS